MNASIDPETWHGKHRETLTLGQVLADKLTVGMGSWTYIIFQTILIIIWIILNIIGWIYHWDPYPFILLNLLFSVLAAYAAPVIMMAQNRQAERDRYQASEDYRTNIEAKKEIEELQVALTRIEDHKLTEILKVLNTLHAARAEGKERTSI
jgi:Predicted membrane protein